MKEFVEKRMGKKPAMKAAKSEAVVSLVIFLLIKKTMIVSAASRKFGKILAIISNGARKLNPAAR